MEFIDTHTHNTDEAFRGEEDEVIARALGAGVTHLIQPDIDSSERDGMFALCERYPGVLLPMLGLYPCSVVKGWEKEIEALYPYRDRGIVAIGEIGLDYHDDDFDPEAQKAALKVQFELAAEWDLPVNIHLRDASEDFLSVLKECSYLGLRGSLHAFGGSREFFERVCRYGDFSVGIGGVVTFRNSRIGRDIADIPLNRIVLETDSPYLSPVPFRGRRNESSNIPVIAGFIARQKGVSLEEVAAATTETQKDFSRYDRKIFDTDDLYRGDHRDETGPDETGPDPLRFQPDPPGGA